MFRLRLAVRCWRPRPVLALCLISLTFSASGTLSAQLRDADAKAAEKGADWLLQQSGAQQMGKHKYGQVALETYALIVAGISLQDRVIQDNFKLLHKRMKKNTHTYSLACYIFALDAAIAQLEQDKMMTSPARTRIAKADDRAVGRALRPYLHEAVKMLIKTQNAAGAWRYFSQADYDNSNVQFAMLGLGVGAKRGVPIPTETWSKAVDYFIEGQAAKGPETSDRVTLVPKSQRGLGKDRVDLEKKKDKRKKDKRDGRTRPVSTPDENPEVGLEGVKVHRRGWDYTNKGGSNWNMTCAGLSSMILARENLRGRIDREKFNALNKAIRDGYGWLMGSWSPNKTFYGAYSLEKVADLGHIKLFGKHDWYRELADHIVKTQRPDGSWKGHGGHGEDDRVGTAFALLILNRATSLLTGAGAGMMLTGQGAGNKGVDRNWVYLESLDTRVHFPSILNILRRRPNPKLGKLLEQVVEAYPPAFRGDMVPELAHAWERIERKSARKVVAKLLEDITGHKEADPGIWKQWHERWAGITEILSKKPKSGPKTLYGWYKKETSPVLKKRLGYALMKLRVTQAAKLFVADLEHKNELIRASAYSSFRGLFIETVPPFTAGGASTIRAKQIVAIKEWFDKKRKKRKSR